MNESTPSAEVAKTSFLALREDLARVLGIQTVDLLIDRGLTEIGHAYPLLRAIVVQDGELRLESLDEAFQQSNAEETSAAVNALVAVMLLIVGRLLGKRVADSIAESVNKADALSTVRL